MRRTVSDTNQLCAREALGLTRVIDRGGITDWNEEGNGRSGGKWFTTITVHELHGIYIWVTRYWVPS